MVISNGLSQNHAHLESCVDPDKELSNEKGTYMIREHVTQKMREEAQRNPRVNHRVVMGDLVMSRGATPNKKR